MIEIEFKHGIPDDVYITRLQEFTEYQQRDIEHLLNKVHEVRSITASDRELRRIVTNFLNVPRVAFGVDSLRWYGDIAQTILGNILAFALDGTSDMIAIKPTSNWYR